VNISKEECDNFGITEKDLYNVSSLKIKKWIRKHAEDGLALLEEHHRRLPEGDFSLLAKATFPLVYEFPARKVFKKIISETENLE